MLKANNFFTANRRYSVDPVDFIQHKLKNFPSFRCEQVVIESIVREDTDR